MRCTYVVLLLLWILDVPYAHARASEFAILRGFIDSARMTSAGGVVAPVPDPSAAIGDGADTADFTFGSHLPLELENYWEYEGEGNDGFGAEVCGIGTVELERTFILCVTGENPGQENATSDERGLLLHRAFTPARAGSPAGTFVFIPPLSAVPASATFGEAVEQNGTARTTIQNAGTFDFDYRSTVTVNGRERIAVPLGTFDTVKVSAGITISGTARGQFVSVSGTDQSWYAEGVGLVREVAQAEGLTTSGALFATNLPEPSLRLGQAAVLACLAGLGRRRTAIGR